MASSTFTTVLATLAPSRAATARTAAEVLGMPWEHCEIVYGDTSRHLPWNLGQFGSNTSFTMTRTNYVAAMDAKRKLQARAREFGGTPEQFEVANERVYLKAILPRASAWPTRRSVPLLWAVYTVARSCRPICIPDRQRRTSAGRARTGGRRQGYARAAWHRAGLLRLVRACRSRRGNRARGHPGAPWGG